MRSQQKSYPVLVQFLEAVPSEAITGNAFFLDFFQNFWKGRYLLSNADLLPFFLALEECFIWAMGNASRYCEDARAIHDFRHTLVDKIITGLIWHDYMLVSSSKCLEVAFTPIQLEDSIQPIHKEPREKINSRHLTDYEKFFGKCIIKILSEINSLERDLLSVFSLRFQADCLDLFQEKESSSQNLDRVVQFIFLLQEQVMQTGERWILLDLVGPTLKKTFPLIETLDSEDAVRLIMVGVSIFGPRQITNELLGIGLDTEQFLKTFRETYLPLCCLKQLDNTTASVFRLDLLFYLLDAECFFEQWDAIIKYLVDPDEVGFDSGMMDTNHANKHANLAILAEYTRDHCRKNDDHSGWCQHDLLDSVAVKALGGVPPFGDFGGQFLCAFLGGVSQDDKTSLVSQNTLILVFEEVCRRLTTFMMNSTYLWVQKVCQLLFSGRSYSDWRYESSDDQLKMVHFALDILNGSLFCLNAMEAESELVQGILAATFVIDWEFSWISNHEIDGQTGNVEARLALCEAVHALHSKICDQFLKGFSVKGRHRLRAILIQSVKSISLIEQLDSENFISSCCQWLLDIFDFFCQDPVEEQQLLELFMSKSDLWPLWIITDHTGIRLKIDNTSPPNATKSTEFIAVVDKLISKIGFDRVVAGCILEASPSTRDPVTASAANRSCYSRPWLAAEVLCSWKWLGGNVLQSFLPSFLGYIKNGDNGFSNSVLNILVEGALVHGSVSELNLLWRASVGELEALEEPFLRALLSFLSTVFQDNAWENRKAHSLFELLIDKLYIDDVANVNCLR
ncbi:hypothetical protein CASFOL_025392 [Castilleja foliolosa]|uniref:E3 ubiquitin-protein ligase listerin n=1 Tax=Castilleja foliolosa TaxID=1961234 RepID=A0ABD3CQZ0_9LAMI